MISVRLLTAGPWQEWRLLRRQALGDSPEAFGATLAEWNGEGDTEQRWRRRLDEVPVNLVADDDGAPVGTLSVTTAMDEQAKIISTWVAPQVRGRGAGNALLRAALDHARAAGAKRVALNVRVGNGHAVRLYRRAGFVEVGSTTSPGAPQPERRMELGLLPAPED